jgi:hypothetical protein
MSTNLVHKDPPPLPRTREEWIAKRNTNIKRTLNDMVEEIHLQLTGDNDYDRYLRAVYDEQAKEGSLAADNIFAAKLIREKATELNPNCQLAEEKAATISKALGVVLRRYNESRKERRNMLDGAVVMIGEPTAFAMTDNE